MPRSQELQTSQSFETTDKIQWSDSVCFDLELITLEGRYSDELSAYRARKIWAKTLQSNFLLEEGYDYGLLVEIEESSSKYLLTCSFETASARYAFFRLTSDQTPEVQYTIETAHIPYSTHNQERLLSAPDMSLKGEPLVITGSPTFSDQRPSRVARLVSAVMGRIRRK